MTIEEEREPGQLAASSRRFEELSAAAGHAGAVIREQVGAIVEAAQSNAAGIERRSTESAQTVRGDAKVAASRVLELIRSAERQVGDLRRSASREADALRIALNKAALRSGPALGAGSRGALDSVATPFEGELGPAAEEERAPAVEERAAEPPEEQAAEALEEEAPRPEAPEPEVQEPEPAKAEAPEPEAPEAPEAEAPEAPETEAAEAEAPEAEAPEALEEKPPEAEAPEGEAPEAAEEKPAEDEAAPTEAPEAEAPEAEAPEPAVDTLEAAISRAEQQAGMGLAPLGAETRLDEARRRVAAKTDEELAEAYEIAVEARAKAEGSGNTDDFVYWDALARAAVEEAVGRPAFGAVGEGGEPMGLLKRRRRARKLRALMKAREQAMSSHFASEQEAEPS